MIMDARFAMVPLAAFADRRLTYRHLVVLGVICSFRQGSSDMSINAGRLEIAERCGLNHGAISVATSELERLGWLIKDGRGGRAKKNTYTICIPDTVVKPETVIESETVSNFINVPASETVSQSISKSVPESGTPLYRTESLQRESSPKGSRLPIDWSLPDEYLKWSTETLGWSAKRAQEVAECFKDYWLSTSGKNAIKVDWFATWRNWCKREKPTNYDPATNALDSIFAGAL